MPTMKSVQTAAPGTIEVTETRRPVPGPRDVLLRVRACGICGTDTAFVQMGGMPLGPGGQMTAIALPRAGYTIISNSSATGDSFSGTGIWFTGHGYNGQIGALSSFQISGISLGGNTVEITFTPQ
jgi:NADPH:quinone reductase-like Zn-dependent oxidoreductase